MKVIAYQVEVNGIQTVIKNQDDLTQAVKETTKAYKASDFGSDAYKQSEKELAKLKNLQSKFRQDVRDTARDQEIAADKGKGSYRALNAELVNLRRRYKDMSAEERKAFGPAALTRIKKLDTELKKIDASMGNFQRNVGNYQQAFSVLGGPVLGQLAVAGGGILVAAEGVRALGREIQESIQIFVDFDRQIGILGAVSRASSDELLRLEENARKLGETTQFTASQVADLQINFARAGFNPDEIIEATGATLDLALATGTSLADASLVVADNIRAYGLAAKDTAKFTDTLTAALNTSNITLESYKESSKELAPVAKVLKISAEESAAAIGILGDNGLKGTAATTTLASGLLKLSDDTKKYAKAAEAAGVEVFNQQGQFVGLGQLIENLNVQFADYTEQQKLAALSQIFGIQSARVFATLMESQKEVVTENGRELLKGGQALKAYATQLDNAAGSAAAAAKVISDRLDGDIKALSSAVEGAKINFVSFFNDGLRKVVQGLTGMVSAANEFMKIPLSDQLKDQQRELNTLVLSLINVNEKTEDNNIKTELRSKLITELQTKYPDFIKNIDLETASTEQLRDALKQANDNYTQKIILQRQEEELNKIFEQRANLIESLVKLQQQQAAGQTSLSSGPNVGFGTQSTLSINDAIAQTEQGIKNLDEQIANINNRRTAEIEQISRLLGNTAEEAVNEVKIVAEGAEEAVKEEINTINALKAKLKELKAERDNTEIGSSDFKRISGEIKAIEAQINSLTGKAKKKAVESFAEGSIAQLKKEISDIQKQIDEGDPANTQSLLQKLVGKEKALKDLEEFQRLLKERLAQTTGATDITFLSSRQSTVTESPVTLEDRLEDIEREKLARVSAARVVSETEKQFADRRKLIELEASQATLVERKKDLEEGSLEFLQIEQDIADKTVEINAEKNRQLAEQDALRMAKLKEVQELVFNSINDVLSSLTNTSNVRRDEEIKRLEDRYQKEIDLAEGNTDRQEELEAELQEKRSKIEREAFEEQKKYRRAAALASLAEGIVNILSAPTVLPIPFDTAARALRIGILTATTAQQIAAINAQTVGAKGLVAEMAKGGILRGAAHSDPSGGIPLTLNGKPIIAEHGEFVDYAEDGSIAVVNKRSTARFRPQLEQMNGKIFPGKRKMLSAINSYRGAGVKFAAQGAILQPEIQSVMSGRSGGSVAGGALYAGISEENAVLIGQIVGEYIKQGSKEGVAAGVNDETKRAQRESRLNERTGLK